MLLLSVSTNLLFVFTQLFNGLQVMNIDKWVDIQICNRNEILRH